jgi:hypothetical protein
MRRRLANEMGPGWLVQFIQQGEFSLTKEISN